MAVDTATAVAHRCCICTVGRCAAAAGRGGGRGRAGGGGAAPASRTASLPGHLWGSLTWDQGPELAGHARFTIAAGIPVYFCDPHSPCQRGSNQNPNGLLRQYFPKGASLRCYTQHELDQVAIQLNSRPDHTELETPAQQLAPLLVAPIG